MYYLLTAEDAIAQEDGTGFAYQKGRKCFTAQ